MATTRILDHYRLSIVNDKKLFHVLAAIYKSDAESEGDLKEKTNLSNKDLKLIVAKLYRANLIKGNQNDGWKVSYLAEEILTSLGISEAVSNSILSEENLEKTDSVFLQACLSGAMSRNYSWSRDISAILRASKLAFKIVSEFEPIRTDEKARILYALVVGTNPSAKNLDVETYCDSVSRWYTSEHPEVSSILLTGQSKLKRRIFKSCFNAISDFKSSNYLLLTGDSGIGKTASLVALSRIIANLSSQRDTSDLGLIYSLDKEVFSRGIDTLTRWQPSIEHNVVKYLKIFMDNAQGETDSEELKRKIILTLKRSADENWSKIEMHPAFGDPTSSKYNSIKSIAAVSALRNEIIEGNLDVLSSNEKREIMAVLTSTEKAARLRFTSEIENDG